MVIFDAGLEEEVIRAIVDRAVELIRSRGGNPGRVDRWGRRRFAFELKHRWEGYYVLLQAQAEPAVMAELDRMLFLADEVLRHKVIRLPDVVAARASSEGSAGSAASAPPPPPPPPPPAPEPAAAAVVEEPAAVAAGPDDNGASEQ
jgi:small subunit ribosomal protein S6